MDDVIAHLAGVDFPATKEDLIDAAVDAEAPQDAVERLQALSQEQYEDAAELKAELDKDD
ncbi:MAG TPA: DUF2795 domain-containing protein [Solirubrobacteraceae bacterium]|jgi:hypothetical protein